jgi:hypothetical protein
MHCLEALRGCKMIIPGLGPQQSTFGYRCVGTSWFEKSCVPLFVLRLYHPKFSFREFVCYVHVQIYFVPRVGTIRIKNTLLEVKTHSCHFYDENTFLQPCESCLRRQRCAFCQNPSYTETFMFLTSPPRMTMMLTIFTGRRRVERVPIIARGRGHLLGTRSNHASVRYYPLHRNTKSYSTA